MRRALFATCLLLFLVAVPFALGQATSNSEPDRAVLERDQQVEGELVSLRTSSSKTFVRSNGERVAHLYAGSVHYQDAAGEWREIDTSLEPVDGRLLNRTNSFSTSLPLALDEDSVRVRKGAYWLQMRLRDAQGEGEAVGNTVRYEDALPGVDVVYAVQPNSVKEDLVLAGPSSRRDFAFDLSASSGLTPDVLPSGAVAMRDARGRVRLALSAPFMVDAKRRSAPVAATIRQVGSQWRLRYELDDRWLDRARRAWPVTVDPSPELNPDADCYLAAAFPESSFCSASQLKVGTFSGQDHRAILRFSMAGIPRGAEVAGATLVAVQSAEQTSTTKPIEAEPLTEPFTGAASWNRADGVDRWSEPGGEADASANAEFPARCRSAAARTTGRCWRWCANGRQGSAPTTAWS